MANLFKDETRWNRGYMPSVPPEETDSVGDAAYAGKNVLFSPYGQPRSWRGVSLVNQPAAPLLQLVGSLLGGLTRGNVILGPGNSIWFIGSGEVFVDDFETPLGVASPLLQLYFLGKAYQAGLPAPSAPLLQIAADSAGNAIAGQRRGANSAVLTRRRSITGAESGASPTSNVLQLNNNQLRVTFPAAATVAGQDQWRVYFSRNGFGGSGAHLLLDRIIEESELSSVLGLGVGVGTGGGTAYTALSSIATNGRVSLLALEADGGITPTLRGSAVGRSAGKDTQLRLNRPQDSIADDFLVVALGCPNVHVVRPGGSNKGVVKPTLISGAWTAPGSEGNPNGETVEIEQVSQNEYRWKLASSSVWSADVAMSTAHFALGDTGLGIVWSDNFSSVDEIGNTFTIEPMTLIAPSGWHLEHIASDIADEYALAVYTHRTTADDPLFYDFNVSQSTRLFGALSAYEGVGTGTPVSAGARATTTNSTTHTGIFNSPTSATDALIGHWLGAGEVAFTPQSPLVLAVNSAASARTLDFNFSDDELLEVEAPRNVDPPPAGTHCFIIGSVMVVGGSLDGSALTPSVQNQFELYDLANTVYLNPVEQLVRVDARPHDGSLYLWTRNSLQTVVPTGESELPIIPRAVWPNTGIANPSAAAITPLRAYAFSAVAGPVRTSGSFEPDDSFARPVLKEMEGWLPEETAVGYDARFGGMVAYCNLRKILVYFEDYGLWSLPLYLDDFYYYTRDAVSDAMMAADSRTLTSAERPWTPYDVGKIVGVEGAGQDGGNLDTIIQSFVAPGEIVLRDAAVAGVAHARVSWGADVTQVRILSAQTVDGRLYLAVGDEVFSQLYEFNCGIGTEWGVRSVPRHGGAPGRQKTIQRVRLLADFDSSVVLGYRRLNNVRQSLMRLVGLSAATGGYAVADAFVSTRQMHDTAVFWEFQLVEPLPKERSMIWAKASGLKPSTTLATMNYLASDGFVAWRVDANGVLKLYRFGLMQDFGGAAVANDYVRVELLPELDWRVTWLDVNKQVKDQITLAGVEGEINEPIGVKAVISDAGGLLDVGRAGRSAGHTGCVKLFAGYADEEPDQILEYEPDGLKQYPWSRGLNLRCPVYQVEACGVGAEQSPSLVRVDGSSREDHV